MQLLPSAVQRDGRTAEAVLLPALLLPQVRQPGAAEGQRAVLRALLEADGADRARHEAGRFPHFHFQTVEVGTVVE